MAAPGPCAEGSAPLLWDGIRGVLLSLPALPEGRPWALGRGKSGDGAGQAVCVESVGCSAGEKRVWRALSAQLSVIFSISVNFYLLRTPGLPCQDDPCGAARAVFYFGAIAICYFGAIAMCCCSKN